MLGLLNIKEMMGLPVLASKDGANVDELMVLVHGLMAVLFVGWIIYYAVAVFRHRREKNPKADPVGVKSKSISNYLELGVAGAEVALLMFWSVPLWGKTVSGFPTAETSEKPPLEVHVNSSQFLWNFRYAGLDGRFASQDPGLVTSANSFGYDEADPAGGDDFEVGLEMVVEVDRPVIAHIRSRDVIHSFWVGPLRVCQDALPGISIPVHFVPTVPGRYMITCAQLCGTGHYAMRGEVLVLSSEDFEVWWNEKIGAEVASSTDEDSAGGSAASFE